MVAFPEHVVLILLFVYIVKPQNPLL